MILLRAQPWLFALLLLTVGLSARAQDSAAPSILFITIDTLRADHLSSYGYHLKTSPNIDKLAEEGVRFDQAYTVTSRTGPSHFSMFTSRYPQEHGAKLNGFAVSQDTKFLFVPQILQRFEYKTGAFVSAWPLTARLTHLDRWFDTYDQELNRSYQMINSSRWAEDVTPKAIDWLKANNAEPFFLWVHYFDPHSPYDLRDGFEATEPSGHPDLWKPHGGRKKEDVVEQYNSEIVYTDHYVQRLLDAVDELGLRDDTLVVLTADHGECLGDEDSPSHGSYVYESVLRVPLIMRFPGRIPAGQVVNERVSTLDIAPTVIDLTVRRSEPEAKIPSTFAGRSLAVSITEQKPVEEKPIYFAAFQGQKWVAPRWLAWMWLGSLDFPHKFGRIAQGRKVVWETGKDQVLSFDLGKDPLELKPNVLADGSAFYKAETQRLERWYESTNLGEAESNRTEEDDAALKSLGYIQ